MTEPKTTSEMISLQLILARPWMATDKNGDIHYFESKPTLWEALGGWCDNKCTKVKAGSNTAGCPGWRDALFTFNPVLNEWDLA